MSPETQLGALAGAVLGGAYRITRLLGEGGMGWVYEARQLRLNKRVAVKLMARELASNPEALARFHREAQITSQLGHPHLVNVMDFGTTDHGEPYMVMEYLDGEDLDHRIRREGRLPLQAAVEIVKQVASALDAAHAEGIVHRDLKPANVFLVKVRDEADFVKVLDFGVSKIKAARTKLTRATAVIGTPDYMSPEQATGLVDEIDHRADQWALGCITWEMVSGRAPFIAEDMGALFYQVINMDPHPLSKRVPDLPPGIEPALRRALAKRIPDRFPSIKDFSRAFEAAALGRQRELTPAPVTLAESPVVKGTVGYGQPAWPAQLSATAEPMAVAAAASDTPEEMVTTHRDSFDNLLDVLPTRKLKPVYLVAAAALVVLVGALLLLRPGKAPLPAGQAPVAAPAVRMPVVNALPALAPAPVIPTAPAVSPPVRVPKTKVAKSPTIDELLKGATTAKPTSGGKPSPFADPFEPDRARPKPSEPLPAPKPARRRPQGQIIEEL